HQAAMNRSTDLLDRGRRALLDGRDMLREYRARQNAEGGTVATTPNEADALFPPGHHDRARDVFKRALRAHQHLEDYDSRLCELVESFGFEIAQKAPYCRPWLYWDDPRRPRYVHEKLGLDEMTFGILHQYALFNRLDPARWDMHYIYDGLVEGLDRL